VGYRAQTVLVFGSWTFFVIISFSLCVAFSLGVCYTLGPCLVPLFPKFKRRYTHPRLFFNCCGILLGCLLCFICCVALHFSLRRRFEFIHIPKNAGTAIEQTGAHYGVAWGERSARFWLTQPMPEGSKCNRYHVPPPTLETRWFWRYPYDYATTFCVTRHPFKRIVSEYKFLSSDLEWSRRMAREYRNGLYDYPMCSVEGLNNFVQTTMRHYQEGRIYIDDCHHVPMVNYVFDPTGNQICHHVLSSDNLAVDFNALMASHGYAVRLSTERHNSAGEVCPDLSYRNLTNRSIEMLLEVYREDFRVFNYSVT
jgi:hypothetical protein